MENWSEMGGDRFRYGCVLEFQMAEGKGSKCYDQSGYNNDGTIYGAIWQKGPMVYALSFDGLDDYVLVPASPSLNPPRLTIEAWIFPEDVVGRNIANYGQSGTNLPYRFEIDFDKVLKLFVYEIGVGWRVYSSGKVVEVKWQHVAVTFDGEKFTFYVDGVKAPYQPSRTEPLPSSTGPLRIGAYWWTAGEKWFDGSIALVRIYDRALSAKEVFALYSYVMSPAIRAPMLGAW